MKRKKATKPAPALAAPPAPTRTEPVTETRIDETAPRKNLKASAFVVAVEGFKIAGFHRCSPISAHVQHIALMRHVAPGDNDIADWWNDKAERRVTLYLVDPNGKAVRQFALGKCVPVNYSIGPFDVRSDAELEEHITIQRATVEPAHNPPKAKA